MQSLCLLCKNILAMLVLMIYAMITIGISVMILLIAALMWLWPSRRWRRGVIRQNVKMVTLWTGASNLIMRAYRMHTWNIEGDLAALDADKWYVILANHSTWLDILVLGYIFNRKIPVIKFFMKRDLLWGLPIIGLACWVLGYPFVRRYSRAQVRKNPALKGQDIATAKRACSKFKVLPTSIVNFVEGTRSTTKKRISSPYAYLLPPKAGGIALVSRELKDELSGLLNVTIHYSRPMTFWKYFRGDPSTITVHYEQLDITPDLIGDYYGDRSFRQYYQKWLQKLWKQKDARLESLHRSQ